MLEFLPQEQLTTEEQFTEMAKMLKRQDLKESWLERM